MTGVQVKQRLVGKGVHREQENHQLVYVWPCWVFLAVCCVSFSVVAASGDASIGAVSGLLSAVASLGAEHRL